MFHLNLYQVLLLTMPIKKVLIAFTYIRSTAFFSQNNYIIKCSTVSPRFTTVSTYDVSRLRTHFKCSALGSFVYVICIVHDVNNCELLQL